MSYGADLRARVLAIPSVAAVIDQRVFKQRMPDESYDSSSVKPCVVYRKSSRQTSLEFTGPDSLKLAGTELHVYSKDADEADQIADDIAEALNGWRGTQGETEFELISVSDVTDLLDLDPGLYRVMIQIQVWYREL